MQLGLNGPAALARIRACQHIRHRDVSAAASLIRRGDTNPTIPLLDQLLDRLTVLGQFTSVRFTERLGEIGARPSIGTVADSYDAAVESFFATLKRELAWIHQCTTSATRTSLRTALFDYIEGFYNPERIQERLHHRSPIDFEHHAVA